MKKTLTTACVITALLFAGSAWAAQITLSWQPVTGDPTMEGYRLFHRAEGESYDYNAPAWEGANTTCTHEFTAGSNGEKYYWVVRAYDTSNNESVDSNEASWATPDTTPPETPQGLIIGAIELAIRALEKLKDAVALSGGLTITEAMQ